MDNCIVITGAAGFIGSCVAQELYRKGQTNLVLVDEFVREDKLKNLEGLENCTKIDRNDFLQIIGNHTFMAIIHLGARTDTTEFDHRIFDELNLNYSKVIWNYCTQKKVPLIYASSAATYGDGLDGFDDDNDKIEQLKPLNPYGQSKQDFDVWALKQEETPPFWVGLKFFNVFGPNEYHKSRMASVVFHTFNQIKQTGKMKLFQSHNPDFEDGGQTRDFIYVKDVIKVIEFWLKHQQNNGIYNLGTGTPRTFNDLAKSVFVALGLQLNIEYVPTPEDIRDKYQYYTKAEMKRTLSAGYDGGFFTLEEAVSDYVKHYLTAQKHF